MRLGVESLERRDCPATAELFNGVLTVTGTDGNDNIGISESGGYVRVGTLSFNSAAVTKVVVTGLGGDDVIRDDSSKPSVIYGGLGDDWIYGGRGNDTIYGGHGEDVVYGGPGDDTIFGGAGEDALTDLGGRNALTQDGPDAARTNSAMESAIIQLVNDFRASNGLPALRVSSRLNAAADLHSLDMVSISNSYGPWSGMQHTLAGTGQPEIGDRLDAAGYDQWTQAYAYGENIAFGYTTAADVVRGWINSPAHRENILNPTFTETGVSIRTDNTGRLFFTQDFGHLS